MQVFKAYFKIIKKNMPQMMIYLVIFAGLSVAFSRMGTGSTIEEFTGSKPNIAMFSNDKKSAVLDGLIDYLGKNAQIMPIDDTQEARQDALFFRKVSYILQIPDGFTQSLLSGGSVQAQRTMIPDSYEAVYTDYLITRYCDAVAVYAEYLPNAVQDEIVRRVAADLAQTAAVTMETEQTQTQTAPSSVYFFNYFAYSLFAIIVLGVTSFMITFQNRPLKRRNAASPLSARSLNFQLILGNTLFALAAWLLLFMLAFLMFGKSLFNLGGVYYVINTLTYTLVCVAISFLAGNLTKSRGAQAAIVNVLSLGLSFISGVFVPQAMLGEPVLKIARFLPTYWYVRGNHLIDRADLTAGFSVGFMSKELGVQLAFIAALFALVAIIIRRKRTANT